MVNQRHARSRGCNLVFQAKRPGRGVRIHHEDEVEEASFANYRLCGKACAGVHAERTDISYPLRKKLGRSLSQAARTTRAPSNSSNPAFNVQPATITTQCPIRCDHTM